MDAVTHHRPRAGLAGLLAIMLMAVTLWLPASTLASMGPVSPGPMSNCQPMADHQPGQTMASQTMECGQGQSCHCLTLCQISVAIPVITSSSGQPPITRFAPASHPAQRPGSPRLPWRPPTLTV